ncbi:MAG: alpha/beta fold hydrolase [Bacilli bacterium]|nr:alpha/beta fold hydrolase [Bacilli bacterium]
MSRIIKFIILIAALLISFCYFCITVDATSNSLVEVFNEVKEYKADSAFNSQLNTNLFTHIDSIDTKEPKITILTPGATCDIETWGSSLINDSYFFDDNSIINYFIRRNANVYCASFKKSSLKYNDLYCVPYTSSGIPDSLLNGSYNNSDYILDTITMDITKPVVILFSPNNEFEGHHLYNYDGTTYSKPSNTDKSAYEELEAMTNYVIYKYMETYYNAHYLDNDFELKIPRINMIGHSRGGIINMQYAIEHPDIVDSLYSIGTPYNGSSVYDAFNDEGIDVLRIIGEPNNAMADCVNDSIYKA